GVPATEGDEGAGLARQIDVNRRNLGQVVGVRGAAVVRRCQRENRGRRRLVVERDGESPGGAGVGGGVGGGGGEGVAALGQRNREGGGGGGRGRGLAVAQGDERTGR